MFGMCQVNTNIDSYNEQPHAGRRNRGDSYCQELRKPLNVRPHFRPQLMSVQTTNYIQWVRHGEKHARCAAHR
jgi:hypothetical protein